MNERRRPDVPFQQSALRLEMMFPNLDQVLTTADITMNLARRVRRVREENSWQELTHLETLFGLLFAEPLFRRVAMFKATLSMLLEGQKIWYCVTTEDNNGETWQISTHIEPRPIKVRVNAVCLSCDRKIFFEASNEGLNFVDNGGNLFQFFYDGENPQQTRRIFNNFKMVIGLGETQTKTVEVCLSTGDCLTAVFSYDDATAGKEGSREIIKFNLPK